MCMCKCLGVYKRRSIRKAPVEKMGTSYIFFVSRSAISLLSYLGTFWWMPPVSFCFVNKVQYLSPLFVSVTQAPCEKLVKAHGQPYIFPCEDRWKTFIQFLCNLCQHIFDSKSPTASLVLFLLLMYLNIFLDLALHVFSNVFLKFFCLASLFACLHFFCQSSFPSLFKLRIPFSLWSLTMLASSWPCWYLLCSAVYIPAELLILCH